MWNRQADLPRRPVQWICRVSCGQRIERHSLVPFEKIVVMSLAEFYLCSLDLGDGMGGLRLELRFLDVFERHDWNL